MGSFLKVFLAFSAYAAFHSLLLTDVTRHSLERLVGRRAFRGWFRFGYVVQATVLLGVFVGYAATLPDRELVGFGGWVAVSLWILRLAGLYAIWRCTARLGTRSFLGIENLRAWWRGEEPAGDGVETGTLVVDGAYRWVRHPMYAAGFVVLWADPRWTVNGVAFASAASLYLWLGALHEERRLSAAYGDAYRRYRARTPRFLPGLGGPGR